MKTLFEIEKLKCSYDQPYIHGKSKVVLEIEHLSIPKGKKIFIVGESGIGKSTILEVIGLMNNTIVPSADTKFVFYDDENKPINLIEMWNRNNDDELSSFRLKHFNFIFQSTNLMRNFSAYENIAITRLLQGYSLTDSFEKAEKTLCDLGISGVDPTVAAQELSGGQQQRIAFARAIIPDFTVLFGDEPTGNLDSENAMNAMSLLSSKLSEKAGSSAVIVSHDMHLAVIYGDVVIKVRKENGHGYIDSESFFVKNGEIWSNGVTEYEQASFENYLRKRR